MNTEEIINILTKNISGIIKGKNNIIKLFVCSFLADGNVLLNDIPGVGKTTLIKTFSKLIKKTNEEKIEFKRLQCTPDLLPYDITGVDIFNAKTQSFEFIPGPVFCDIFLADEINRTPPKVQSALLEVMEEKQVTIGRTTHKLNELFFTAATQNPIESLGTYPLPVAQLDRFMISLSLGYPDDESALEILNENPSVNKIDTIQPVINTSDIFSSREEQKKVFCHIALKKAIIDICKSIRNNSRIELGPSPRASLQLLSLAKTVALSHGRAWIEDLDIKLITPYVISHRCVLKNTTENIFTLIQETTEKVLSKMNKDTDWSKGSN